MTDEATLLSVPATDTTDNEAQIPVQGTLDNATTELLRRVRGMPSRRTFRTWFFPSAMFIAWVASMVWLGMSGHMETPWPAFAALALCFVPGSCIWVLAERRELRTIKSLTAINDIRVLCGLLENANCYNRRLRTAVEGSLSGLLPRVTLADAAMLGTGHREVLNSLLYNKSGDLAIAALSAIEQVGDGTALPYLTSIAAGKGIPSTLRERKMEVQERARHTVETIRERIDMHNRASVLLRASQIPSTPSEQLVRPAQGQLTVNGVNGAELLRADAGVEHDPAKSNSDEKENMT